jgi:transcriptional regulator with XRE-family HTH domain
MPRKTQKSPEQAKGGDFGQRVAAARRAAGMTQAGLADAVGVHISHIHRIEAGSSQPTVDVLKRLAEALHTSIDLLVFDRPSQEVARRLTDLELIEQFTAVEGFSDRDKQALKTILGAMIVRQRVEAAVR